MMTEHLEDMQLDLGNRKTGATHWSSRFEDRKAWPFPAIDLLTFKHPCCIRGFVNTLTR